MAYKKIVKQVSK